MQYISFQLIWYRSRTSHTWVHCGQSPPYLQNVLISCNYHQANREEGKILLASLSAATAIEQILMHMCASTLFLHVLTGLHVAVCMRTRMHTHSEFEELLIFIAVGSNHTNSLDANYCLKSGFLGESEIEFLLPLMYGQVLSGEGGKGNPIGYGKCKQKFALRWRLASHTGSSGA